MMDEKQKGAVTIVEATFVFPIMFFIIFIMLMACEAYFQYARVEGACIRAAISGAARCENPMMEAVLKDGKIPTSTNAVKVRPYRYIFTSEAKNIAGSITDDLTDTINGYDVMVFKGMSPSDVDVHATSKMGMLVSSFTVDCSFKIKLPIRMIFSNKDLAFEYKMYISEPIGDPAEFIRNVSTVQDYLERSKLQKHIDKFVEKVKGPLQKLASYTN